MRKLFAFEAKQGITTPSIWDDVGLNQHASSELEQIFGAKAHFDTPKPTSLLARVIQIATFKDSIVLDCFAGSGTTGHAALKLNSQDNGSRRFLLIESQDYAETTTAERLRAAIRGYDTPEKFTEGLGGGFDFYTVGKPLYLSDDNLNEAVGTEAIRGYVAYSEGTVFRALTKRSPRRPKVVVWLVPSLKYIGGAERLADALKKIAQL